MISKAQLKRIGFDRIDRQREYAALLGKIEPQGTTSYKDAYAYGLGMLLQFNSNYLISASQVESQGLKGILQSPANYVAKTPQYLHIVIASESDGPHVQTNTEMKDLYNLQGTFKQEMSKGANAIFDHLEGLFEPDQLLEVREQVELSQARCSNPVSAAPLKHTTAFIPFFTESNQSEINVELSNLVAQLEDHGKLKAISKKRSIKSYINQKINEIVQDGDSFLGELGDNRIGSQPIIEDFEVEGEDANADNKIFLQKERRSQTSEQNLKVIMFTICISQQMQKNPQAITQLFESITEVFDQFIDTEKMNDIVICLNIHNDGQKVKNSLKEQLSQQVWTQWTEKEMHNTNFNDYQRPANELVKGLHDQDVQSELKKKKRHECFISIFRLASRIISLGVAIVIFIQFGRYRGQGQHLQERKHDDCFASEGSFRPKLKFCDAKGCSLVSTYDPSKTAEENIFDSDDGKFSDVVNEYSNVSSWLHILSIVYLVVNSTMMVTFILNNFVKAKRGCLYYIKTMYHFMSIPYFLTMIFMLVQRFNFTTEVCLCTFKEEYLTLRNTWKLEESKNPQLLKNPEQHSDFTDKPALGVGASDVGTTEENHYPCQQQVRFWFDTLLVIEFSKGVIYFIVILWHYYKNVFQINISVKKEIKESQNEAAENDPFEDNWIELFNNDTNNTTIIQESVNYKSVSFTLDESYHQGLLKSQKQ